MNSTALTTAALAGIAALCCSCGGAALQQDLDEDLIYSSAAEAGPAPDAAGMVPYSGNGQGNGKGQGNGGGQDDDPVITRPPFDLEPSGPADPDETDTTGLLWVDGTTDFPHEMIAIERDDSRKDPNDDIN
jgi:hypothetical protein